MIPEPGRVGTKFSTSMKTAKMHPAYLEPKGPTNQFLAHIHTPGIEATQSDPDLVVKAVVDVVASNDIPLRLPMGSDAWGLMKVEVEGMSMELDK